MWLSRLRVVEAGGRNCRTRRAAVLDLGEMGNFLHARDSYANPGAVWDLSMES